jgi:hypothetical protein
VVARLRARIATFTGPLALPSPATIDVMRRCLGTTHPWRDAAEIKAALADPAIRRAGLMPLLLHAAGENGTDPAVRSLLRASRAHEDVRLEAIGPVCAQTIAAEQRPLLVLRGVALAFGAYEEPALRHCHDLDLLVGDDGGLRTHANGFPIARHLSLFGPRLPPVGIDDVLADAVPVVVAGQPARTLEPADAVVHLCAHAATRGHLSGPLWGLDVAMLARRHPGLDWSRVAARARVWQVAGVVAPMLEWLSRALGVRVPPSALHELRGAARVAAPHVRLRLRRARRVAA